jgi:hypothetical protein
MLLEQFLTGAAFVILYSGKHEQELQHIQNVDICAAVPCDHGFDALVHMFYLLVESSFVSHSLCSRLY